MARRPAQGSGNITQRMLGVNQTLCDEMRERGFSFKNSDGCQHFVDAVDRYVDEPIGFISGPWCDKNDSSGKPYYVIVRCFGGWLRRFGAVDDLNELEKWAVNKQADMLSIIAFSKRDSEVA